MNTIKTLSFSALLAVSVNASAGQDVQMPDLTAALQQRIEHRMAHLLDAELSGTPLAGSVMVVRAEARGTKQPAS